MTVTDPRHPLIGRTFKLAGVRCLPDHVRYCQVEIVPGQFTFIPVASTSLSYEPRATPLVLTESAIAELVETFQAMAITRRANHGTRQRSQRLGQSGGRGPGQHHRDDHSRPHGGGGQ